MAYARKRISKHAYRRIAERSISHDDVMAVLRTGTIIRKYEDDVPAPSYIMLGWPGGKPLHVVAADDTQRETTVVITAYYPDAEFWDDKFERRKQ